MRCYSCNLQLNETDKTDVCSSCKNRIRQSNQYFNDVKYYSYQIEPMLKELEQRIPGLFQGVACPGNCLCKCTNKSGCKLLTSDTRRVTI